MLRYPRLKIPLRWLAMLTLATGAGGVGVEAAVPRAIPTVAEIVTVKGDEQVRFVEEPRWRIAEATQDVAPGDALQTGPYGGLALLFHDATQIRVHRNTMLIIKSVRTRAGGGETGLRLEKGSLWSRARSVADGVKIETPSVTAAIRGTDWHLRVEDDGRTTLIVLAGVVDFANAVGAVTVTRGEVAVAEIGRAPTKTFLLRPKDRPQWELTFTPDWLRMLPVTGLTPGQLRERATALAARPDAGTDPALLLERAEIAYELGDADAARALLGQIAADSPRRRLLEALLAAHALDLQTADQAFVDAIAGLQGRPRLVAEIGRFGILLVQHRYADAEAALAGLSPAFDAFPELVLAAIMLASYRGDQEAALDLTARARRRFPSDSRFPLWTSHLALLLDEPEQMRAAIEAALALDPSQYLAWHLAGTYHQFVVSDPGAADTAYARALDIVPLYAPTWNNLALLRMERGDYKGAREAVLRAITLAPREGLYKATYAALLILVEERLDEGERQARESLSLDPGQAAALQALGSVALRRGRSAEAVDWLLRATVVSPGLAGAATNLAIAYYQAGDFETAMRTIQDAIRLDPNDALAPLIASIFSQDQAEAGQAIRYARDALDRALRSPRFDIESLAKSQDGIVNLGSAYTNLGLDEWGQYHGHLSFNPAWAASHFFLANEYDTASARRSEALQGLLLDPLAVSSRARYFDLVRRPFTDVTLAAAIGAQEDALTHSQVAIVQGFARLPTPVAFAVDLRRDHSDGVRDNSRLTTQSGIIGVGARLQPDDDVLLLISGSRTSSGLPGPDDAPDANDRIWSETGRVGLGYHRRIGADHHILARIAGTYVHQRFVNDDPFGSNVSGLSLSLLRAFGVTTTRGIYGAGLCQAPVGGAPIFLTGGLCGALALPVIPSDLPERFDLKSEGSIDAEVFAGLLQARHLFRLGPVRITYGGEWSPSRLTEVTRSVGFEDTGTGSFFPGPTFPLGAATEERRWRIRDRQAAQGYVGGEWIITPALRAEAALFVRHFDDDEDISITQPDPRAGIAWQPTRGHWLRAAAQRDLVLPLDGSLAPVAAVGLLNRDDLTPAGGSTTSYQARWDAEWSSRIFTFVSAEHQDVRRLVMPIPLSLAALSADKADIQRVGIGVNAWLGERWGVFAEHRWLWSENHSRDAHHGRDLPLVPERIFDAGVNWVHPWQIRGTFLLSYVGERAADLGNTATLDDYWTAHARLNWQPDRKHWSFTLAADNLFDERYEVASGFPGVGFSVSLSAQYRFGGAPR